MKKKKPTSWDRAVVLKPYPTNFVRVYGMRAIEVEKYHTEFTEVWIENMRKNVLFDNFTSSLSFEADRNMFVVRFECPDVYESECNVVIP